MRIELRTLPVNNVDDLYHVHETALQIGRASGLAFLDQVDFGYAVAKLAEQATHSCKSVSFSLKVEDELYWLEAYTDDIANSVRKQAPKPLSLPDQPFKSETFWKSRKELEKSQEDMEQFTFAISHDLKNSLTKLKLALSLVEEEEMPTVIHSYIQIIHRSAERLEKTMLSLNSIIELGHASESNIKKVSAPVIFDDVIEEFSENLNRIGAKVQTNFDKYGDLHYVEVYLKSVFSNLLSNAIKYRSPGRPLQLQVATSREPAGLTISFVDNGEGIDLAKFGSKLFLPFTRFSRNSDGSGLGLYLIKNMVERNGGRIDLESKPGEGTSYRIFLKEYQPGDGAISKQST